MWALPDDLESASFIDAFQTTETLFDVALFSHRGGNSDTVDEVADIVLARGLRAGRHETCWTAMKKSLLAVTALIVAGAQDRDRLLARLAEGLTRTAGPCALSRERVARGLTRLVAEGFPEHSWSAIEVVLSHADAAKVREVLDAIVLSLSKPNGDVAPNNV